MELRLDRLLDHLRHDAAAILAAIDTDPLLLKRTSGGLVLANAGQKLYTPQAQHQLYAKGIVYLRDPYRLVSLPLVKIYNVGERDVKAAELSAIAAEPGVRLRWLRKLDGSLIQVFRHDGRVWFTTRGMIEGARWRFDEEEEDRVPGFDFLAEARRLAGERYPRLLEDEALLDGRTLLFEFIHPQARKVTDYGDRADLVLLTGFDRRRVVYLDHDEVSRIGQAHGLTVVDMLAPAGADVAAQMESLLASMAGTDEEGSVVSFERGGEVIYRVKVKSPEYLHLMRLLAFCTYERTVALVDAHPEVGSWADLRAVLITEGRERVPEEVLGFYREHWERYQAYLADLGKLRAWAEATCRHIDAEIGGAAGRDRGEYRKAFAAKVVGQPNSGLIFAALDGRLDVPRLRKVVRSPDEAREMVANLERASEGGGERRGSPPPG